MQSFMIRIILHSPVEGAYVKLHTIMKAKGFERTIFAVTGKRFSIPTAEYISSSNKATQDVLDDAKACANAVDTDNGVMVVRYDECFFNGLKEIPD